MIEDVKTFDGDSYEFGDRVLEAGYACRGIDYTRAGFILTVYTRDSWLIRIKRFADTYEVAAFNPEGFLCPVEEAL